MDYSASKPGKPSKKAPKHLEHNERGTAKTPFDAKADKAALLARLKAAAEAKKQEG
ncbi:hypothetical protein [Gemmobacter denitrificans]|uniref:DUF3008 family protein n=1 Tax=Gemmobacter denitrificans TaxID=3123040 RepID=A0ABU8BV07_9RHOB